MFFMSFFAILAHLKTTCFASKKPFHSFPASSDQFLKLSISDHFQSKKFLTLSNSDPFRFCSNLPSTLFTVFPVLYNVDWGSLFNCQSCYKSTRRYTLIIACTLIES